MPQFILLALVFINIGINIAKDGEHKNERYSFVTSVIANAIIVGLLYWGGFFD